MSTLLSVSIAVLAGLMMTRVFNLWKLPDVTAYLVASNKNRMEKERKIMSNSNSNKIMVPNAREAMNKFKMEAANEVGVNLKQGYNGDLTSKQAGSVGGQMVKKMIESYENGMK